MSTTRINDSDLASVALYDKVNAIANEIDEEKADYSDFNRLNNEAVKLTGNQDIDGAKTFQKNLTTYGGLDIVNGAVTKGTNPTSTQYWGLFRANDKTRDSTWKNTRLGIAELSLDTNGTTQMIFGTYKNEAGSGSNALIAVGYNLSSGAYATAPTPPAGSNSTNIATTAWVKANAPAPTITYLD